jgi:hypothetical protein
MHQRGDWCALDRPLLDVLGAGGLRPVASITKDFVHGSTPVHPVLTLVPEAVGGAGVDHVIRRWWPRPAPLFGTTEMRARDDQSCIGARREFARLLDRSQRRFRAVGPDNNRPIAAHVASQWPVPGNKTLTLAG